MHSVHNKYIDFVNSAFNNPPAPIPAPPPTPQPPKKKQQKNKEQKKHKKQQTNLINIQTNKQN